MGHSQVIRMIARTGTRACETRLVRRQDRPLFRPDRHAGQDNPCPCRLFLPGSPNARHNRRQDTHLAGKRVPGRRTGRACPRIDRRGFSTARGGETRSWSETARRHDSRATAPIRDGSKVQEVMRIPARLALPSAGTARRADHPTASRRRRRGAPPRVLERRGSNDQEGSVRNGIAG